jgi:hypothetical protein
MVLWHQKRRDIKLESEENRSKSAESRIRLKVARPYMAIEAINKVVTVLYRYKTSATYKDISSACGMHPVMVSQALAAARDVGLVESAGRKGLYILTAEGVEYARFISAGKATEAKNILRIILKKNPLWAEIIRFLSATRGQSRDPLDLVLEIERITGKRYAGLTRSRLRDSLVSILEAAEMVIKEGSKIIPVDESQIERSEIVEGESPEMKEFLAKVKEAASKKPSIPPPEPSTVQQDFAILRGDDFTFEVRKDLDALEFVKKQFADWIEYVRVKLEKEKQDAR